MPYQLTPINTVLLPEFQHWTDEFGMIIDTYDGMSSGNGILFTCHYIWGLKEKGLLNDQERQRLIQVLRNNFIQPGLMTRGPAKLGDYEAYDDYIGIMGIDAMLGSNFVQEIYQYGKDVRCDDYDLTDDPKKGALNKMIFSALNFFKFGRVNWVWNNKNPGKFNTPSWFGYRPDVTGTLIMARKKLINPIHWIYWAIYMLSLGLVKKDSHDAYILRTHMANACSGYGWLTEKICKYVHNKVKNDYIDFGKLLGAYFNKPEHPLVQLLYGVS